MTFLKIFLNNMKQNGLCQPKHNKNTPMYRIKVHICDTCLSVKYSRSPSCASLYLL